MDRRTANVNRFPALATGPRVVVEQRETPAPAAAPSRAAAVDALRGLAILGMVLVAAEPLGGLPAWMYHAQTPPPTFEMNTGIAGFTWPDLVFPMFMFCLGVAIPLSLARRLERGAGLREIAGSIAARGVLLVFFALFRQHFDAGLSGLAPGAYASIVALTGFAVLFLVFMRLPDHWGAARRTGVRAVGWAAAIAMFALVTFPDGSRFRPERIDIILLLLAYCAVFGTIVWLCTRHSILARLGVLAVIASFRIVGYNEGWVSTVYAFDPVPWLYKFAFFQFLCAVIPGTIVGDMLLDWRRSRDLAAIGPADRPGWSTTRVVALALVLVLAIPAVLTGIQARYVFTTTLVAMLLSVIAVGLSRRPAGSTESLISALVPWGVFWLLLGLLMDPFDGGTKKVPETFAWFFQGCGLAIFALVALIVLVDVLRRPRWVQLLVDVGQNPMMAYVGLGMAVGPVLGLIGITRMIDDAQLPPWVGFGWSAVLTLMVALLVRAFTRRRIVWRS